MTICPPPLKLAGDNHFAASRIGAKRAHGIHLQAQHHRHCALARWHGLLHQASALAHDLDGVAKLERADRNQRAIFAQAMTGDKSRAQRRLGFEHSQSGDRCRENRRLGILGQFEIGFGTGETKSG